MSERVKRQLIPDRLVCPNCPADYSALYSRRHITCRRCGTSFLAPDDGRKGADRTDRTDTPAREFRFDESSSVEDRGDGRQMRLLVQKIRGGTPLFALGFGVVAVCFWVVDAVSFEAAILTMVLVTNGALVENQSQVLPRVYAAETSSSTARAARRPLSIAPWIDDHRV
jgi:hypothetical protein